MYILNTCRFETNMVFITEIKCNVNTQFGHTIHHQPARVEGEISSGMHDGVTLTKMANCAHLLCFIEFDARIVNHRHRGVELERHSEKQTSVFERVVVVVLWVCHWLYPRIPCYVK